MRSFEKKKEKKGRVKRNKRNNRNFLRKFQFFEKKSVVLKAFLHTAGKEPPTEAFEAKKNEKFFAKNFSRTTFAPIDGRVERGPD